MDRHKVHKYRHGHSHRYRHRHDFEKEICCQDLKLRNEYRHYHRFFIFSPMFLASAMAIAFFVGRGQLPKESYEFLMAIVLLVTIKETVGVMVSRRIYNQILRPVEDLKIGLFEVSKGNYDLEIAPTNTPEITQLIEAFNNMSQKLKASEAEKEKYEENRKALIASISHDLKTPITAINGFVDGILEGVADSSEKQEAYMKIIQQNSRYMNRLIDDLLLYAKLDLHKLTFECHPIDYGLYISELFMELSLENEEQGVAMTFENQIESSTYSVIDSRHMTRAIRNITANAVTHGACEKAEINFKLLKKINEQTKKEMTCLTITDNGHGISSDQIPHIFERFYRGDDARTMTSGSSGLGLAIAKEIVEAHQGFIWVESQIGKGTTIGIEIPIEGVERPC